jgi:hypothetical protein
MSNEFQQSETSATLVRPILFQVVPRLTPGACGVSDTALALAVEMKGRYDLDTIFLVLNSSDRCSVPFQVIHCRPGELLPNCVALSNRQSAAILVHLSGYGYSADGVPALLASALAQVKAGGRFRIAVYFHELFASGPPWKSAFWTSRRQQREVRTIAGLCDLIVTNTRKHADWLERQFSRSTAPLMKLMPVFSTVGEAQVPEPFAARQPAIAVFGLPGSRQAAYKKLTGLAAILEQLGIKEILDIGPTSDTPPNVNGIAVSRQGELSAADLARMLSSCRFGFTAHPPFCAAKSSIFAGYCAQGVIPVLAESFRGEVDGLTDGIQVVSPSTVESARVSGWENCSRSAWNWYLAHSLRVHAEQYVDWMSGLA